MTRSVPSTPIGRRAFAASLACLGAGIACSATVTAPVSVPPRLTIRPERPSRAPILGLQPIGLLPASPALQRDGVLYVPTSYRSSEVLPLVVLLHGATGSGNAWFGSYAQRAEDARVVLLAPDSRSFTWDALQDEPFGPDVRFLEAAIASTFARCAIDASRLAIVGFSDGASYALSLGLANGDVFQRIVAYSPGAIVTHVRNGKPSVRVFHGINDGILAIDHTSRRIVPELRQAGYDVVYSEFDGGHEVPLSISTQGMDWLTASFRVR